MRLRWSRRPRRLGGFRKRIHAQATVWVAELHDPDRSEDVKPAVRRWLALGPIHREEFERVTDGWETTGNLPPDFRESLDRMVPSRARRNVYRTALTAAVSACAASFGAVYWLRHNTITTDPNERTMTELSDGTQVTLNANSKVLLQYDKRLRKVTLAKGEAAFNVIKDPRRPFIVVIGDRKVVALGTSFDVRRENSAGSTFAVTLSEGRVVVEPISWPNTLENPPSDPANDLTLLLPGQRVRIENNGSGKVDSPSLEKVTAWQRGQLIFDNLSLRDAAAEFNRYGRHKITIDETVPAALRVGGVFRIGDRESFADAMAATYKLHVKHLNDDIVLTGASTAPK